MSSSQAPGMRADPQGFCGGRIPWPLITELADGDEITACYMVHEKRRAETRNNKPYLKLLLGDRTGTIDGYVWDDADRWDPLCPPEQVVGVRGRISSFQDRLQLRIVSVQILAPESSDLEYLLPASPRSREHMEKELLTLISSVRDEPFRKLLRRCLGANTESGRAFRTHPAAKKNHHAYLSGLLEHTLSVAHLCDRLAEHYQSQGAELDRDLLITGALLHDLGKVRELKGFPAPGYTTAGQLLGHIIIGMNIVSEEAAQVQDLRDDRRLLLLHLIASHQGKPEWDSPKVPQVREALMLHYADDLDAKMNQVGTLLQGVAAGEWSGYDRSLGRSFFRSEPVPPAEKLADVAIDLFRS